MKQRAQGSCKIYVLLTYKITSIMPSSENNFIVLCCLNSINLDKYTQIWLSIMLSIILINLDWGPVFLSTVEHRAHICNVYSPAIWFIWTKQTSADRRWSHLGLHQPRWTPNLRHQIGKEKEDVKADYKMAWSLTSEVAFCTAWRSQILWN